MLELSETAFHQTMTPKMSQFWLNNQKAEALVLNSAKTVLTEKGLNSTQLELSYCYQNTVKSFAHYLLSWGPKENYLVMVSDDRDYSWHGFYFLDILKLYGLESSENE